MVIEIGSMVVDEVTVPKTKVVTKTKETTTEATTITKIVCAPRIYVK